MTRYMSASSVCSPRTIPRSSSSPRKKIACWCRRIRISGRCSRFGKRPVRLSSSFAACRTAALPLSSRCCWRTSHLSRLTLKLAPWWSSSRTASECADFQCSLEASVASHPCGFRQCPTMRSGPMPASRESRPAPPARRTSLIRYQTSSGPALGQGGEDDPLLPRGRPDRARAPARLSRVRRRRRAALAVHPPRSRRGVQHRRGPNDLALSVP